MKKTILVGMLMFLTGSLVFSGTSFAGEETSGDYLHGIGTKFSRGVWNIVASPAEIPCGIRTDMAAHHKLGMLSGFGNGVVYFGRRLLVGVTEVMTFIIPMGATLPPVCHEHD